MDEKICSVCQGTGWVLKKSKKGNLIARRCKCYHERNLQSLMGEARIPERYKECRFENFDGITNSHRNALKISKKFVSNYPVQDIGLLFLGPCGVGKTHLAVAILNELIKKKHAGCIFYDFRELTRDIQNTYTPESILSESQILAPVFGKDVLVVDDLGARRPTSWVEDTVFYIINNRYNNKKVTIFTSNYPDNEEDEVDKREEFFKKGEDSLLDRIGVRLRSRLYEMCKIVRIEGDDYRMKYKQGSYRF